jgi:hypothetical protein
MTLQWTVKSLPLIFSLDVAENNREFQSNLDLTVLAESAEIKFGGRDEHRSKYRVKRFLPGASGHGYFKYPFNPVIRSAYLNCAIASASFIEILFILRLEDQIRKASSAI